MPVLLMHMLKLFHFGRDSPKEQMRHPKSIAFARAKILAQANDCMLFLAGLEVTKCAAE